MNITHHDDPLIPVQINAVELDLVHSGLRAEHFDARGDLLRGEAGIHIINDSLRHTLDRIAPCVAALTLLDGKSGHINDEDAVTILFGKVLIAVHLHRLAVGRINNSKITVHHTGLQHLEQDLPNILVVFLSDHHVSVSPLNGGAAQHTDLVCGQNIVAETMFFDIGGFSAAGCATEQKQSPQNKIPPKVCFFAQGNR